MVLGDLFFPNLLHAFMPDQEFYKWWYSRSAVVSRPSNAHSLSTPYQVQYELNAIYSPPPFDLSDAYAQLIRTLALALIFGPLCPLLYPLTVCKIHYYAQSTRIDLAFVHSPLAWCSCIGPGSMLCSGNAELPLNTLMRCICKPSKLMALSSLKSV